MSWGAVVTVVGSAVAGEVFSSDSAEISEAASEASLEAIEVSSEIAQEQWDRYLETFAPLEEQIIEEVSAPVEEQPGFAATLAAINREAADVGATTARTLGGRYQSGSGLEEAAQLTTELGRLSATGEAYSTAEQNRFANLLATAQLGQNISGTAAETATSVATAATSLSGETAEQAEAEEEDISETIADVTDIFF